MVVSGINESTYLSPSGLFPGNKSFSMNINFQTSDSKLSPVVDLDNAAVVFVNNRTNAPVSNYATDFRVNTFQDDPNRFFYITKPIVLENPATSLRIQLDAYVHDSSDIRAFFSLNQDLPVDETLFVPFPGYNNLDAAGNIISTTNSDGLPDRLVPKEDTALYEPAPKFFKEYTFTANNLNPFSVFRIKLIGTTTNSSVVPQIKNLRVISFA
jgi:hypothetical protein